MKKDRKQNRYITAIIVLMLAFLWGYSFFVDNLFISGDVNDSIENLVYSSIFLWPMLYMIVYKNSIQSCAMFYTMLVFVLIVMFVIQFCGVLGFYVYMHAFADWIFLLSFAGLSVVVGLAMEILFVVTILIFRPARFACALNIKTKRSR